MLDITAKLRKVIWRSFENDFTIAAFEPETGLEFIATGDLFTPAEGIMYELSGEWTEHAKYGRQFRFDSYCVREPVAADSIKTYLEKHIKGIGPVWAEVFIEKYGKNTIMILKGAPERVSNEVKGISYEALLKISEQLQEGDKRQEILMQLEGIFAKVKGLPRRLATDLLNMYGLTAYEVVKSNPYSLGGMYRVGFVLADRVAMACGVKKNAPERIKAGIIYFIKKTMQDTGDGWIRVETNTENLPDLINGIKKIDIEKAIFGLVADQTLTEHNGFVTLANYADDEDTIADCVERFII